MGMARMTELLWEAKKKKCAIPAFNVENMESIQGVMAAAKELDYPVIIQTTPSSVRYGSLRFFAAAVKVLAEENHIRAVLHLDHGSSCELVLEAIEAGYASVMFDGSALPWEENIRCTRRVVEYGRQKGIAVEAELGCIGGKEDDREAGAQILTRPEEAAAFVRETGIDSLAVAIGTAHGFYKGVPRINMDRLKEIHDQVDIPLVLHGTSGVPAETVRECIQNGMCKVNYATDLRQAFTAAVRKALEEDLNTVDPKRYLAAGRDAVTEVVKQRIQLCADCG